MWTTLKIPSVWRPCLYMYSSIALSWNIRDGMFYWYTDADGGPSFSEVWTSQCYVSQRTNFEGQELRNALMSLEVSVEFSDDCQGFIHNLVSEIGSTPR